MVSGTPGDQTHLFKGRAQAPLTFWCIVCGRDGQLAPKVGWASSCPASWPSHTCRRARGGASWLHQMPYSRVQLMPHTVQTNFTFPVKWLGLDVSDIAFNPAERTPHVYSLVSRMHELWSDHGRWWPQTPSILQGILDIQPLWLWHSAHGNINNPFYRCTKAASVGTRGLN